MRRASLVVFPILAVTLVVLPVAADWDPDPGDPPKMHFPQLPDPNGWDVFNTANNRLDPPVAKFLADDWRCTETGEINEIHIWGSWRGDLWDPAMLNAIHVQIHADDRSGPFSRPGDVPLWSWTFALGQWTERVYGQGDQGWYNPNTGEVLPQDHRDIYQYNIRGIEEFTEPFVQTVGEIYWLVVVFDVPDAEGMFQYGWKTSQDHFEDAAVWSDDRVSWQPLSDPITGEAIDLAFVVDGAPIDVFDFGDAPDFPGALSYPTLFTNNGAHHIINPNIFLGASIDNEPDGQPDGTATGDDLDIFYPPVNDDEDGVVFTTPLVPGSTAWVDVTASVAGRLDAWIDFNANGDWVDPGEQVFSSTALAPGLNSLSFAVPGGVGGGVQTFSRFRFSTAGLLGPTGIASDGEVEDHLVFIDEELLDFGDAPEGMAAPWYPTRLINNGPRHTVVPQFFLGGVIDPEPDGQPTALADGDDLAGVPDDEDGVVFTSPIYPGNPVATVDVTATAAGRLNAWLDFDGNHSFDAGDQIFADVPLAAGVNNLSFAVPVTAVTGQTFARFRFSSLAGLTPVGYAPDGEVEDYVVAIEESAIDFGDASFDPSGADTYRTMLFSNGARHAIVTRFFLGGGVDPEPDGQPTLPADGDDVAGPIPFPPGDEDGVVFTTMIVAGDPAAGVDVTAIAPGLLDAWIDFDQSFTFDPGDRVFTSQPLAAGLNSLTYAVPASAATGPTYARFRFSANGVPDPWGFAPDGEVEDYAVDVVVPLDFGDAPDQYPVVLASNGARHLIQRGFHLGAMVDSEPDGQPDGAALGDDNDLYYPPPNDDEDGVTSFSQFVVGWQATMDVTASVNSGLLNAWIDFDQNGIWDHPAEQIFTDLPLALGTTNLAIQVPLGIPTGDTYARFRFSSAAGLTPRDLAPDGEVEDYIIRIEELVDFGDAPAPPPQGGPGYPTMLPNGAHHTIAPPIHFGDQVDREPDGQPNANATGDDLSLTDDEDGVFFPAAIVAGDPAAPVDINVAGAPAFVNAWMDINADMDWNDPGEHILVDVAIAAPGPQHLNFAVPPLATPGPTFARFRISSFPGLLPTGKALDGEVEDHQIRIDPSPYDFGDAPDTYPTVLANNGAYHQLNPDLFLGALIDTEGDGIPDGSALGDDTFDLDDEDGVFSGPMVPGALSAFDVIASRDGLLNAWVDFDQDGDWQPGEQIFIDEPLLPGPNHLVYMVPGGVPLGPTFARFRFSTTGGLRPDGPVGTEPVPDGEVEDHLVRIAGVGELDFGDAPEIPYPTLLDSDGARHVAPTNLNLGFQIDNEGDGFPTADASGDDMDALDDEDGISFTTPLRPGDPATVTVFSSVAAYLDGWIDFNADGDWFDPGERIFTAMPIPGGAWTPLGFNVPLNAELGLSFARFRLSSAGGLDARGLAADGEVEDELVFIGDDYEVDGDFGDAPDSYQTLLSSVGAWHSYVPGIHLGATIDLEHDGKPDPVAAGDDAWFLDDEDGVAFVSSIVPADTAIVEVTAATPGLLDGWIDFGGDGDWLATDDRIFLAEPLAPGVNNLAFAVPMDAVPGQTFARFRFSRVTGGLPFDGWAPNGEVEDYEATITPMRLDFGDAPDPTYPTLLASDGARHVVPSSPVYFLGASIDDDPDGQPDGSATGDDTDGNDDEDGVRFTPHLSPGSTVELHADASVDGVLNAWIDFNGDGDWDDADEHIVIGLNIAAGLNVIPFSVPVGPEISGAFARIRFTPDQGMGGELPTGLALDGEVEDYYVLGTAIFSDGFETSDTSMWSSTVP